MNRYGIRVAKSIVQYIVLFVVFYSVLSLVGSNNAPISTLWETSKGLMLLGAIIVFALLQPFFGYTKKTLIFDANKRKEDVERVMAMCGYIKESETQDEMIFRASSTAKRITLLYEDAVTIKTDNEISVMQGPRKEVVKIYFRMGTFIG